MENVLLHRVCPGQMHDVWLQDSNCGKDAIGVGGQGQRHQASSVHGSNDPASGSHIDGIPSRNAFVQNHPDRVWSETVDLESILRCRDSIDLHEHVNIFASRGLADPPRRR